MFNASTVAILIGVLVLLDNLFLLSKPGLAREALMAYPRMRLPAQILTAVCLVWFAWNLWHVDFGGLSVLKNLLFLVVPLGWYLIVTYIPDLLSVRALCCLLLLAGNPLLVAIRWQGFPSWVLGVLIYVVMIKAMIFAVYPHFWKRGVIWLFAMPQRTRGMAALGLSVSALLILSGLLG